MGHWAVPFDELPREEQEKDIRQYLVALRVIHSGGASAARTRSRSRQPRLGNHGPIRDDAIGC